jgi:hypothetical protein
MAIIRRVNLWIYFDVFNVKYRMRYSISTQSLYYLEQVIYLRLPNTERQSSRASPCPLLYLSVGVLGMWIKWNSAGEKPAFAYSGTILLHTITPDSTTIIPFWGVSVAFPGELENSMFVTRRSSIPWPCRSAIVRLRMTRGTWNTNFKVKKGLTLLKTETNEVLQLYILDDCLKIHHESKFTCLLILPIRSFVLCCQFWWSISEGFKVLAYIIALHFIYNLSEPFYRQKFVWRFCTGLMEGASQSVRHTASHQQRRGALMVYCLYNVSTRWFFAIHLHSHQAEYENILVSEKYWIWMKSTTASPSFIEDSLVDVLYLNLCSLEFHHGCLIEESEIEDMTQTHISSVYQ